MAYEARYQVDYSFATVVPPENPIYQDYQKFLHLFGDDSRLMVIGVQKNDVFEHSFYRGWYELGERIKKIEGVQQVLSIGHLFVLEKDDSLKRFVIRPLVDKPPSSQKTVDSLKHIYENLPFYHDRLYNPQTGATLMVIAFNKRMLDSEARIAMVNHVKDEAEQFARQQQVKMHYAGLPFIRTYRITTISREVRLFLVYAGLVTMMILLLLFRSFNTVFYSMLVVIIGVIWSLGLVSLLGYKINILTALIPALIIVIGIPNCVYLVNKYHSEFIRHGSKIKALTRMTERVGYVTFFANLTTAIGFVVFYFTDITILQEFGIVAGLMITATFLISLVSIPVFFSFLKEPKEKHTSHLDSWLFNSILDNIDHLITNKRKAVYITSVAVVLFALGGILKLKAKGYILDDVPESSDVYRDLKFVEQNFGGVMPFEVMLSTERSGDVLSLPILKKIDRIAVTLDSIEVFSRPFALSDGFKFATQAYYRNNPAHYRLPENSLLMPEWNFILKYLRNSGQDGNLVEEFIDSTQRFTRISTQIADVGSDSLPVLLNQLMPRFKKIMGDGVDIRFTGTSVIAYEGFNYIIHGLISSVLMAFLLISLIMAYLFRSIRMLFISLIPNLIPLALTAGMMGYAGIDLKPSTVLIFSIAFGISVDYAIHFLGKYRQELPLLNWSIQRSVSAALHETGRGMIYNSLILFFGFSVFTASTFKGTVYLGLLTSSTLVVALFSNLILLPSLLLTFDRMVNKEGRYFRKKQVLKQRRRARRKQLINKILKKSDSNG